MNIFSCGFLARQSLDVFLLLFGCFIFEPAAGGVCVVCAGVDGGTCREVSGVVCICFRIPVEAELEDSCACESLGIYELFYSGCYVAEVFYYEVFGGVGFQVFMPTSSLSQLGSVGEEVSVYTHLHVREDNISLYGFGASEELGLFETMLGVSGLGPRLALAMLSTLSRPCAGSSSGLPRNSRYSL